MKKIIIIAIFLIAVTFYFFTSPPGYEIKNSHPQGETIVCFGDSLTYGTGSFLTLGGNDLKNGVSRETAFTNLRMIIEKLQAEGALVIIGGIDIPFWGKGFGSAYQELARETGSLLVKNILQGIIGDPQLMSDRIHPNSKGYALMARSFYEALPHSEK